MATRKTSKELQMMSLEEMFKYIEELETQLQKAEAESRTDSLTGLPNLRAYQERAEREVSRAGYQTTPFTLGFADVNGLGRVNDTYGHAVGDELLKKFARTAIGVIRPGDMVARTGGDEFLFVLPNMSEAQGKIFARRLMDRVNEELFVEIDGEKIFCGVSIGTCELLPQENAEELRVRADGVMYELKRKLSLGK